MHWTFRQARAALLTIAAILLAAAMVFPASTEVPVQSAAADAPLSGRVVAVDAGHGGYDGGARAPGGRWEKAYNLDVALRLRDCLSALGATVVMTRDGDYALCDPNPKGRKKRQDMERRAEIVTAGGAELLVSVHMNEYRDTRQSGPQVFFRSDCAAGRALAELTQGKMVETLSPKRARAASPGDFYILSLGIPSMLVECGFLSNPAEEALLRTDAYESLVAQAIADGVAAWFALEERPKAAPRENR